MKKIIYSWLIFAACNYQQSMAGGVDKLMKYAASHSMVNVNKAAIIDDQQGGYLTGGSVIVRGPQPKNLQPLVIQTPKFAFDACTGSADFRFGGLSYIAAKEFTQFFKNTATAAGSYAVKMLIKSACPQCEDIMSYLETVARDINGLMMDQCTAGQAISGGLFNALSASNQQKCLIKSNINQSSKDMYEASDKCRGNPDRYGAAGDEEELQSLLGDEFNLVWKALGKCHSSDIDFKELIMSVSGTIIGRKIDGSFHFSHQPSLITSSQLLEEYIGASNQASLVKLYKCSSSHKCLDPQTTNVRLEAKETIYGNISRILEAIATKIFSGGGDFTDEEQAVVAFSSIPLIQLIEMEIIHKGRNQRGKTVIDQGSMIIRMQEFLEVVCYDVVTNFLTQMIDQASSAVALITYAQTDDVVIKNFTSQVSQVRRFITDSKFAAFKRLQIIMQCKERLLQQQNAFKAGFGRILNAG